MHLKIMLLGTTVGGTYLTSTIRQEEQRLAKRRDSQNLGVFLMVRT